MRKTLLSFLIVVLMSLCGMPAKSQSTLTAGDIAFVGYNADAIYDDFTFVLLKNISSGTTIHFTDFGWCSDINGFQKPLPCGANSGAVTDGAITWMATSALPSGTQITITSKTVLSASVGSVTGLLATYSFPTDYMTLAVGGDQIFAFQGTLASPTLIAGISMDGAWLATLTQCQFTSSQSALPSQLNSTNSIAIVPEIDNAAYNCSITTTTPAELRAAVLNPANWLVNDVTPFVFPMCTFSTETCSAPAISSQPANRTICTGNNTTFSVSATGTGLTYQWQINSGYGFTNISNNTMFSNVTTSTLSITGATSEMNGYAFRCNVTGTCGNVNSNSATLSLSTVSAATSQTNIACNGGSTGSAMVTPFGGVSPYTYAWNTSASITSIANNLPAGSHTVTITDNIGCKTTKTFILTQPTVITSSVVTNNAACAGVSNGSAIITVNGGTAPYTYSWSPSGGNQATAGNLAAGNYVVTIMDINGCTKNQNVTIGVNNGTQEGALAALPGMGATTQTANVGSSNTYSDGNCNLVTTVQPSGTSPVTGNVTTKVWVENSVPSIGGKPYVARHYEITPAINPSTSTGTVTLYFLQSEFDAFNAAPGSVLNLPANASDEIGISNVRIAKYSGVSSDNSGNPLTYSGAPILIDPNDNNIVWNASVGRWEISFEVDGFSGFIVQTSTFTLPVTWNSFRAETDNSKVFLTWKTGTELNTSHFNIEHSTDGINYASIGSLDAAGNSNNETVYNFTHHFPAAAANFYRIQQVDVDGRYSYSEIRKLNLDAKSEFSIVSNPVRNGRLELQLNTDATVVIYTMQGQEKKKINARKGSFSIDVHNLTGGMYILRVGNESRKFVVE